MFVDKLIFGIFVGCVLHLSVYTVVVM